MSPVFLSYARLDNERDARDQHDGWVSYFYQRLRLLLAPKLGRRIEFWRDVQEIQKGAVWHDPIKQALEQTKVLLAILSPAYLNSENCMFELNYFLDRAATQNTPACAEAVIKILKEQIDDTHLPTAIREPEPYQFFLVDNVRGSLAYYDPAVGLREDRKQEFLDELARLANRLVTFLRRTEGDGSEQPQAPTATVFVAVPSPGSSLAEAYSTVVAELSRRRVRVVPDRRRFYAELDTPNRIVLDQAVTNSVFAVHLIDPAAGKEAMALDGLQLAATAERAGGSAGRLRRMLWLAPKSVLDRENELAESLRLLSGKGGRLLPEDSLVEEPLLQFLTHLRRKLLPDDELARAGSAAPGDARPSLFVLASPEEVPAARNLAIPHLRSRFRCRLPFSVEATPTVRAAHEVEQLKRADGVAIYWGGANEEWVHAQLERAADWQALGRPAAFAHRIVVLGPPASAGKDIFYDEDAELLDIRRSAG